MITSSGGRPASLQQIPTAALLAELRGRMPVDACWTEAVPWGAATEVAARKVMSNPHGGGAGFARALKARETPDPELAGPNPEGDFTGLACETGGRW